MAEVIEYFNEGTWFLWHRCDDELPNDRTKVLATDEFGNVIFNYCVNGEWVHNYAKMVAWAKVPSPYKGVAITNG